MANEVPLETLIKAANQKGLQLTSRRYRQLAKEDKVPEPVKGQVDALTALIRIAVYYQELAKGSGSLSLTDERTRLTRISADRKHFMFEVERGMYVRTDILQHAISSTMLTIKQRLLAWSKKLSPLLEGMVVAEREQLIATNVNEILEEMRYLDVRKIAPRTARLGVSLSAPGELPADAPATAETDGQ